DNYITKSKMSTTFCSSSCGGESFAGHAVDLRRPLDDHVRDRLVARGDEREQPFGTAALDLLDERAAIGPSGHPQLADEVGRRRSADLVVEDEPPVEVRPQAVAANFDGDGSVGGALRPWHLVELVLGHIVRMSGRPGPDVTDDRNR